jgi:hypothetical protein
MPTSTMLNLLLRGEAVCVTFTPSLSAGEYSELLIAVDVTAERGPFEELMAALAAKWSKSVRIEPC